MSAQGKKPGGRPDPASCFRNRLNELLFKRKLSRNDLVSLTGLNRSSVSQLLSDKASRLPRIETLVQIARSQNVSIDWLLGLTDHNQPVDEPTGHGDPEPWHPFRFASIREEQFMRWREDYSGMKIRYFPTTLPEPLKCEELIEWQYRGHPEVSVDEAIEGIRYRKTYLGRPGADMEICSSIEMIQAFARGDYLWHGLPLEVRQKQIRYMVESYEALYPTFRWFCIDARQNYLAVYPVTIFGQKHACLYLGHTFLSTRHVDTISRLTREFDGLIKIAVMQPLQTLQFLKDLLL
ncbi:helix-turn-helix domain-containing protein [Castellaniella sp.]|uniref:helix-turn-helix domain-containing protein n=1 Tax=Castellaniella sp. TaxID=1955812 RepID=UPI003564B934